MKRGAEVIDKGDSAPRCNRNDNHNWKQSNHKRMRYEDRERSRYGYNGGQDRERGGADTKESKVKTLADKKETDPHRLAQRQKQIDYGKNTIGYDRYCAQVPRHQRKPWHPMTPDKTKCIGKKVFDGIVRKWRQALHQYDPPELTEATKTMETENAVVTTVSDSEAGTDEKAVTTTSNSASTTVSTKSKAMVEAANISSAPVHSIYENFYEDNFDDEDTDDDDLL